MWSDPSASWLEEDAPKKAAAPAPSAQPHEGAAAAIAELDRRTGRTTPLRKVPLSRPKRPTAEPFEDFLKGGGVPPIPGPENLWFGDLKSPPLPSKKEDKTKNKNKPEARPENSSPAPPRAPPRRQDKNNDDEKDDDGEVKMPGGSAAAKPFGPEPEPSALDGMSEEEKERARKMAEVMEANLRKLRDDVKPYEPGSIRQEILENQARLDPFQLPAFRERLRDPFGFNAAEPYRPPEASRETGEPDDKTRGGEPTTTPKASTTEHRQNKSNPPASSEKEASSKPRKTPAEPAYRERKGFFLNDKEKKTPAASSSESSSSSEKETKPPAEPAYTERKGFFLNGKEKKKAAKSAAAPDKTSATTEAAVGRERTTRETRDRGDAATGEKSAPAPSAREEERRVEKPEKKTPTEQTTTDAPARPKRETEASPAQQKASLRAAVSKKNKKTASSKTTTTSTSSTKTTPRPTQQHDGQHHPTEKKPKIVDHDARRTCDCWGCAQLGVFRCSTCKSRWYCSRSCQRRDWENCHKKQCAKLKAERGPEVRPTLVRLRFKPRVEQLRRQEAAIERVTHAENGDYVIFGGPRRGAEEDQDGPSKGDTILRLPNVPTKVLYRAYRIKAAQGDQTYLAKVYDMLKKAAEGVEDASPGLAKRLRAQLCDEYGVDPTSPEVQDRKDVDNVYQQPNDDEFDRVFAAMRLGSIEDRLRASDAWRVEPHLENPDVARLWEAFHATPPDEAWAKAENEKNHRPKPNTPLYTWVSKTPEVDHHASWEPVAPPPSEADLAAWRAREQSPDDKEDDLPPGNVRLEL